MKSAAIDLMREVPATPRLTLDEAFRTHSRYVAGIATRLLGRDDEVDDLVQDVFLQARGRLESLRDAGAIRAWLATITVRLAMRKLRWRRLRSVFWSNDGVDESVASASASPEDRLLVARIYRVLETLPVEERVAWSLRFLEGSQIDEIARAMALSMATVKRRIESAQHALRGVLGDE
ncbi:MAG: polymerase sigma factor RpoE [Labilithrix sp.]|nr:polymerase sigma factor RpoE [Labilithrix sp.]